jgi:hypothetical protein
MLLQIRRVSNRSSPILEIIDLRDVPIQVEDGARRRRPRGGEADAVPLDPVAGLALADPICIEEKSP